MKPMCVNCKRREVFSINGKKSSVKLCMHCTDQLLASFNIMSITGRVDESGKAI